MTSFVTCVRHTGLLQAGRRGQDAIQLSRIGRQDGVRVRLHDPRRRTFFRVEDELHRLKKEKLRLRDQIEKLRAGH